MTPAGFSVWSIISKRLHKRPILLKSENPDSGLILFLVSQSRPRTLSCLHSKRIQNWILSYFFIQCHNPDPSPNQLAPGLLQKLSLLLPALLSPALLQSILHKAAKVVHLNLKLDHICPLFKTLQWFLLYLSIKPKALKWLTLTSPAPMSLTSSPITLSIAYSIPTTLTPLLPWQHTSALKPLYCSSRGKIFQAEHTASGLC